MTLYTYAIERIGNGHRVSASDANGILRWRKDYFRRDSRQAYDDHRKLALRQAATDCPAALENARVRTFAEILDQQTGRAFKYGRL